MHGAPAGSQTLALVAAKGAGAGGKLQQRFRRLLQKVDGLRQRVRGWKEARPDIETAISTHAALLERTCRLGRDFVGLLDRAYPDPRLGKADRKRLAALISTIAGDLIERGEYDELKPIYSRYSRSDFDVEAAAADAAGARELRSMMECFGMDFGDADVSSMEKLQAFTEAQLDAFEQATAAEEARRAQRKKSAKQQAAEARREEERRHTGKALQDVYRALALALHPDHERDPVERARKTELMQQVNVAYEAKDLLRLLELQLELERVDPARADAIAEERLQRYNRILDEQAGQLRVELDDLELPFRMELEVPPGARLTPADVIARVRGESEMLKEQIAEMVRDLEALQDVTRLKAWLKAQAAPRGSAREREQALERELDLFR